MRRIKPISIYPPPELRSRIEVAASGRKRSLNAQIILVLERWMERADRKAMEKTNLNGSVYAKI